MAARGVRSRAAAAAAAAHDARPSTTLNCRNLRRYRRVDAAIVVDRFLHCFHLRRLHHRLSTQDLEGTSRGPPRVRPFLGGTTSETLVGHDWWPA